MSGKPAVVPGKPQTVMACERAVGRTSMGHACSITMDGHIYTAHMAARTFSQKARLVDHRGQIFRVVQNAAWRRGWRG